MPPPSYRQQGLGSGVIVSPDGYILTNNHVVEDADSIRVALTDARSFEAQVVGTDKQSDLAVLKVDASKLPTLPLGDSDALREGEWVLAVGNPFGLQHTVTFGIVSALGRGNVGLAEFEDFIQTDAAINPGNSGGALLNMRGELVGVNTAIASRTGGYQGVGFAIPANMSRNIMNQLIQHGVVKRGWLGVSIQDVTPEVVAAMKLTVTEGVLISGVLDDGPASESDIERGDVIIAIDGQPVKSSVDLKNQIAGKLPGSRVEIDLLRDSKRRHVKVQLAERARAEQVVSGPRRGQSELGLTLQDLDAELAERLEYAGERGVVITAVQNGSVAARAGLRRGDLILEVNRESVSDLRQFQLEMDNAEPGDTVLFLVKRRENTLFVPLKVPE